MTPLLAAVRHSAPTAQSTSRGAGVCGQCQSHIVVRLAKASSLGLMRPGNPFFSTTPKAATATAAAAARPSGKTILGGCDFLNGCSTHFHDAKATSTEMLANMAALPSVSGAPLRYWRQNTI